MLRYEVYVNNRLVASFSLWQDAAQFAGYNRSAMVLDFDRGLVYHFEGNQIHSQPLIWFED